MNTLVFTLLALLGAFFVIVICDPQLVPTKLEQKGLLEDIGDLLAAVETSAYMEGNVTNLSVISDTNKVAHRAKETLSLLEELALIKIKCANSENIKRECEDAVQRTVQEGYTLLDGCIEKVSQEIQSSSNKVCEVASAVTSRGQCLIDILSDCTKKPGLQQISCYRKVMVNDVIPLKVAALNSIESHKLGHLRTIEIRESANNCVDQIMKSYQAKLSDILSEYIL